MNDNRLNYLSDYVNHNETIAKFDSSDNWIILNKIESSIKDKIELHGVRLKDWNVSIKRGVLTGYNDAFIITEDIKNQLIIDDPKSAEIIRPILRGKDIKRYSYDFHNKYIITIPCGFTKKHNKTNKNPEEWFKNSYPAIYAHFMKVHAEYLKLKNPRSKGLFKRDDQGDYWWELRSCDYMDNFTVPKIMYSEIVQGPQFYLDEKGVFYPEATTFILNGEMLVELYLMLNSSICFQLFKKYYAGGGLGEDGIRYKKKFLENLPLPKPSSEDSKNYKNMYNDFVHGAINEEELCSQVDNYLAKQFDFSQEEINALL